MLQTDFLKKWGATMAEYKDITSIKEQIAHVKRNVKSENSDYLIGYISALSAVEGMIASLPATDVEPVKHGHWYNRGGRFRCTVCDTKAYLKDVGGTGGWSHEYIQQKSPYCPNCGAKMDGKEVQE